MRRVLTLTVVLAALYAAPANAQVPVLSPPFTSDYAVSDIGAPAGVPPRFGG